MHINLLKINNSNMKTNKYKFMILTDEEFESFVSTHPLSNFFQSIYMKELLIKQGREVYLLGIKEEKNIVCATLLVSSKCFIFKSYEALKGYLIDYNNYELINLFTNYIKKFIRKKGGFRLIIDPYIIKKQRDIDGNIIKNGIDNTNIIKYLKSIKFKEINNNQVKWTFVLDTNKNINDLLNDMRPNTRNAINKTLDKYKLVVEELSYDKLDIFKKITQDTSKRRNFNDRSLKYYQDIYTSFKNNIKVLVCKLDVQLYINTLLNEKEHLINKINNLSDSNSNIKKKKNFKNEILNIDNKINYMTNISKNNEKYIILSGAMFIMYGNEIVYLFSGSYEEFMKFNGQYRLQYEMIKYASLNNYKRYNFYGIYLDKNSKDYGVYEFKKGFNGYVEELLGAFEVKVTFIYYIYNLLKKNI